MDWFYADNGRRLGPISSSELAGLHATGQVLPGTLVWRQGMANWAAFETVQSEVLTPEAVGSAGVAVQPALDRQFCSRCGAAKTSGELLNLDGTLVCGACKDLYLQQLRQGVRAFGDLQYAGFWIRFVAVLIDGVILWLVQMLIMMPIFMSSQAGISGEAMLGFMTGVSMLISFAVGVGYETFFIGYRGATPGKMMLSLKVVRADGSKVGYGLAAGRYVGKILSYVIFGIGFIMIGFDEEKRGLHDRICETRVVKVA